MAVIAVVLFHARVPGFGGGFVGVDVFFVISGYLITGLIAAPIAAGTFSLVDFYERRVRRLFPALFTLLAVCCVPAYWLLLPEELEDFGQSVATTALFASNFLFFSEAGYFAGPADAKPLLHTWSLAIEEQFYLLFPALLLLCGRWRITALGVVLVLSLASFAVSVWSVQGAPTAAFYLLPSRGWELLLGAALALVPRPQAYANWVWQVLACAGMLMILYSVVGYSAQTPFPGMMALLPCAGTALVILGGSAHNTWITRALRLPPLVFVGLISYSLYLWHWPLLVFSRHYLVRELSGFESALVIAVSCVVAVLSWRYVERPFRGTQTRWSRLRLWRGAVVAGLVLIVVGLVYDESEGLPARLPEPVAAIAAVGEDKPLERKRCEGIAPARVSYDRLCRIAENAQEPTFVFWGDSHASMLMRAVRPVAQRLELEGLNASSNGCPPLLGVSNQLVDECLGFHAAILDIIESRQTLQTVILIARWARYVDPAPYRAENGELIFLYDELGRARNAQENLEILRRGAERTLIALGRLQRRVVVLGPVPEVGLDVPDVMAKTRWREQPLHLPAPRAAFDARQQPVLQLWRDMADRHAHVRFVPIHALFCDASDCAVADATGRPLYFDGDHLAGGGAQRLQPLFERLLR